MCYPYENRNTLQFLMDGKKVYYDFCSSKELDEAKQEYEEYEYIGSSKIMFINGVENVWDEMHHFFKFKKS